MYRRLLRASLFHQPLHSAMVAGVAALAGCVLTGLLSVTLPIEDELQEALRRFGANLVVEPAAGGDTQPLHASDVTHLREILWRNRISGVCPLKIRTAQFEDGRELTLMGGAWSEPAPLGDGTSIPSGVRGVWPDARLEGRWPDARQGGVVVGRELALEYGWKSGTRIAFWIEPEHREVVLPVTGILLKGGEAGRQLWMPLEWLNTVLGEPGTVDRLQVAALTSPEIWQPDFDARKLSAGDFDRWYCKPTVSSVSYQIERAWPGSRVRVLRRVSEASADLVRRARTTLWTLAALALLVSALAIATVRQASLVGRFMDVGLLRSLGATDVAIMKLFFGEALVLALLGFLVGFPAGFVIARHVGHSVFGVQVGVSWVVVPVGLLGTALLSCLGSWTTLHRALSVPPIEVLRA